MRVIGIDPGSRVTGWGIIEEKSSGVRLIDYGAIVTQRKQDVPFSQRLAHIYHELQLVISYHNPQEAAIEEVFAAKNLKSALKLGQARGAAVAACATHNLAVFDYEPTLVKKSLVGVGRAEKTQVAYMVRLLLSTKQEFPLDTSDALAVALCHLNSRKFLQKI